MRCTQKRVALVTNPWSAYPIYRETPEHVRIKPSKARCAGQMGVTFYAPGWRWMVFSSLEAAQRKLESHPGFVGWAS